VTDNPQNDTASEIEDERLGEIESTPTYSKGLRDELRDDNAASPADSGGDLDADWHDVENTGSESVGGHNPTPDQSDTETNAHAMGLDYQDNEPLDLLKKMEKRDDNRFELDEGSKTSDDMI
jgi:hypothetical protein